MDIPRLFGETPPQPLHTAFRQWFQQTLGLHVLQEEERILAQVLPDLFGYHALQVGQLVAHDLLAASRIRHRCIVDTVLMPTPGFSPLIAEPEYLPFDRDSLDLVLLHHGLDAAVSPHALLREAARVLIPDGHLLIVGFNPWSLWGLWRLFRGIHSPTPWLQRPLSAQRLADWLSLLDFEVVGLETVCFVPPLSRATIRQRFLWLEKLGRQFWQQSGAVYVLLARKRVSCLTPLEMRQQRSFVTPAPVLLTEARVRRGLMKTNDFYPDRDLL